MANWNCHFWLIDIKNQFTTMTSWERRAFIYASYSLGDEGNHWRKSNKGMFSKEEKLLTEWFASRKTAKKIILV